MEQRDIDRFGKADAQRMAAARELHQKTGIDLRQDLDRLSPVPPVQEFGSRSYFAVDLQPTDAIEGGVVCVPSITTRTHTHRLLRLPCRRAVVLLS